MPKMEMNSSAIVIAIDGPSASGKSSVARLVAEALGFLHVDTGSMYRTLTWKILKEGCDIGDTSKILHLIKGLCYECDFIESERGPPQLRNRMDGVDPGSAIRTSQVEEFVSKIAAIPQVRQWLVQKQRELTRFGNLVVEGRDIGTVVFPETPFKFYLDADPQVRAQRRATDQITAGVKPPVKIVGQAIAERDRRDSTRTVAPLKTADDATRIDTSAYQAQDVADLILKYIRSKYLAAKS